MKFPHIKRPEKGDDPTKADAEKMLAKYRKISNKFSKAKGKLPDKKKHKILSRFKIGRKLFRMD